MRHVQHMQAQDNAVPADPLEELFRDLRATAAGLSGREAARRLEVSGPNELVRRGGRRWPGELVRQFTHPLTLLLTAAAGPRPEGATFGPARADQRPCRSGRPRTMLGA